MKRLLTLLLSVSLLFVFTACGEEQREHTPPHEKKMTLEPSPQTSAEEDFSPLTVFTARDQQSYWGTEQMLCRVSWMQAALGAGEQMDLPELMAALESVNFRCQSETEAYGKVYSAEAREAAQAGELDGPYFRDETLSVQRADTQAVSLLRRITSYQGGIHPDTIYECFNLDTATGQTLALADVFVQSEELGALLEEKLLAQYPDASFFDLTGTLETMAREDRFVWSLGPHGVTFYFSPYTLASFADGPLSVSVYFTQEELFRSEYLPPEESYVLPMAVGERVYADLDPDDGQEDVVHLECIMGERTCQQFQISLNDAVIRDHGFSELEVRPYLVHQRQADSICSYLYLSCLSENRTHTIYIYDLNGHRPRLTGQINDTGFHEELVDNVLWTEAFHHPDSFRLDTRIDLLSTLTGVRTYRVDFSSGDVMADEESYELANDIVLTSRQAILAEILPLGVQEQLPPGTKLHFLRTDGSGMVEMETEKGRKCRIYVDRVGDDTFISGVPAEQCFDGMQFAG